MKKYYVLYCNYSGLTYEIGFGNEGLRRPFFERFREKHGYDKYGHSYDRETQMDLEVYEFDKKEEVIEFVSDNMGVVSFTSPEDYKRQQLENAKKYVDAFAVTQL